MTSVTFHIHYKDFHAPTTSYCGTITTSTSTSSFFYYHHIVTFQISNSDCNIIEIEERSKLNRNITKHPLQFKALKL